MFKSQLLVWILAAIAINALLDRLNFEHLIIPLFIVSFFAFLISKYRLKNIEYFLFFSISLTSLLGFTETLTGFYAESTNALLFGLSFYSASMAYLISQDRFGYKVFCLYLIPCCSAQDLLHYFLEIFRTKV